MTRNLLLIILDSARKDVYDKVSRIHNNADIRYNQARSASCWSVPSHASMFSGLLPSEHGIHAHNIDLDLTEFGTICDDWNGQTFGVSSNVYASSVYNFDKIFDSFVDIPRYQPYPEGLDATAFFRNSDKDSFRIYTNFLSACFNDEYPIRSLINGVSAQLKKSLMRSRLPEPIDHGGAVSLQRLKQFVKASDKPVFGFANLMETHIPYSYFRGLDTSFIDEKGWSSIDFDRWDFIFGEATQKDIKMYRQYHRATIEYVTRKISKLADDLKDTTIIVTSDHGENLGYKQDNELWGHTSSLSEGVCHVPLDILNAPVELGDVSEPISHLDLREIIRSLNEGQVPNISREITVAETLGMAAGAEPPKNKEFWNRAIRAAWWNGKKEVWDINNEKSKDWARSQFKHPIEEASRRAQNKSSNIIELDSATEARLEDLGYK